MKKRHKISYLSAIFIGKDALIAHILCNNEIIGPLILPELPDDYMKSRMKNNGFCIGELAFFDGTENVSFEVVKSHVLIVKNELDSIDLKQLIQNYNTNIFTKYYDDFYASTGMDLDKNKNTPEFLELLKEVLLFKY